MDADPKNERQNSNNARIFALAFATFAIAGILMGSYYVKEVVINQKSIIYSIEFPNGPGVQTDTIAVVKTIILLVERFLPLLLISLFTWYFVRASISFVKAGEYARTGVVPPRDLPFVEDAIKQGKPEPIDQYIRLASLTGGVGLFQKIGLTGLPLTTLALVVFFAFGVMWFDDKSETFKAFLDFEKLILGAFIGSFVQKQVERRGQESDIQRAIQNAAQDKTDQKKPS